MTVSKEEIAARLTDVRQKMAAAAMRAGRSPEEVTLLPVTKTQDVSVLEMICASGIEEVGENRVQEILEKKERLGSRLKFHMIGHLQRNKVREIAGKVVLIHSADSAALAEKINEAAAEKDIFADILIEVNVSGEKSKFGIAPEDVEDFIDQISGFDHLCVKGLMTVAPDAENPEENRWIFREMKKRFDVVSEKSRKYRTGSGKWPNVDMTVLSMGMTNDYEIAIEEGATLIRVGTALFGKRNQTE